MLAPTAFLNPALRPNRTIRHWSSLLLAVATVVWALASYWGTNNADWEAYRLIFDERGAWLVDTHRDPAFVALVQFFQAHADYETMRAVIAVGFVGFTAWFLASWGAVALPDRFLLSYVAVLPLLYPRVTVQIREGLADVFVLAAITMLNRGRRVVPVLFLGLAAAIHGGTGLFAALVIAVLVWQKLRLRKRMTKVLVGVGVAAAVLLQMRYGLIQSATGVLVDSAYSGFEQVAATTETWKAAYWAVRCAIVAYLALLVRGVADDFDPAVRGFLRLTSFAVLPLAYAVQIVLVWGGFSVYVASGADRLLTMVTEMVLAIVAMRARKSIPLLAVIGFVLYDQERVLMTAASVS